MKRVSLIAAGLLAFGLTAARAEVGATDSSGATDATQPAPTNVDINVNTPPKSDVDVNVTPRKSDVNVTVTPPATTGTAEATADTAVGAKTMPPSTSDTTTVETIPPGADVDVNVNPTTPAQTPPAAVQPLTDPRPPLRRIDANSAAIYGGVTEPAQPIAPVPSGTYVPVRNDQPSVGHTWVGRLGAGFLLGGGYEDFTNENLRSQTGGGGAWDARLLAGTRQFVGVEAAYVGAARSVDALGLQSNALLLSNGVEGAVRLNVPVVLRRAQLLEPFGFVGLGWQHYQVTNTNTNTSDIAGKDDIMSLPVGGGLEYAIGRFMADARFTYRSTYYNDLMRTGGNLNNWGVGTNIGFAF
jgi:hypothetical protein